MFAKGWLTRRNAARARAWNQKNTSSDYRVWKQRQDDRERLGRNLSAAVLAHGKLVAERTALLDRITLMANKAGDAGRMLDESNPVVLQARHRIGELATLIAEAARAVEAERVRHDAALAAFDAETRALEAGNAAEAADEAAAQEAARAALEAARAEARAYRDANAILLPATPDEDEPAPKPRSRKPH